MAKVRDRKLVSMYGQRVLDSGFYSIPNLILDYQDELNLSDAELLFYIKVSHFYAENKVNVKKIVMSASRATKYRIRQQLIDKGYLELIKLSETRVIYNWQGLIERLNQIVIKESQNDTQIKTEDSHSETKNSHSETNQSHSENSLLYRKEELKEGGGKEVPTRLNKRKYKEKVSLTEDEYARLVKMYGEKQVERMIEILSNYKIMHNKEYASDYAAMLDWVADRYQKEKQRPEAITVDAGKIAAGKKRYEAIKKAVREGVI